MFLSGFCGFFGGHLSSLKTDNSTQLLLPTQEGLTVLEIAQAHGHLEPKYAESYNGTPLTRHKFLRQKQFLLPPVKRARSPVSQSQRTSLKYITADKPRYIATWQHLGALTMQYATFISTLTTPAFITAASRVCFTHQQWTGWQAHHTRSTGPA